MKTFVAIAALLAIGANAAPEPLSSSWQPAKPHYDSLKSRNLVVNPLIKHGAVKAPAVSPASLGKKHVSRAQADNCGMENPDGLGRSGVVNGFEANPHQFPWAVTLECVGQWFCTASIISENWILSAAHCVDGCSNFRVTVGAHDRDNPDEYAKEIYATNGFTINTWNDVTLADDIALVELPSSIEFNDAVMLSCLPSKSDGDFNGEMATATGWGKTSDGAGGAAKVLHYIDDREIISNTACRGVFGSTITDGHICIKTSDGNAGVCNGDSGGPLNVPIGGNQYVQVGIASFVSGAGCGAGFPDGYTRVTTYLDWIESSTGIEIP